jgi:hypothetical protein
MRMSSMASSRRSDSIVRIFARMTSVLPAAATSRSRYLPPPRANDGQITFAQASWIPDLSARLLGALRL